MLNDGSIPRNSPKMLAEIWQSKPSSQSNPSHTTLISCLMDAYICLLYNLSEYGNFIGFRPSPAPESPRSPSAAPPRPRAHLSAPTSRRLSGRPRKEALPEKAPKPVGVYRENHHFLLGKLTMSMAIFNSKLLVYQRVPQ